VGGPWSWVGNLITALATIAGVLVTQLFSRKNEERKAAREEHERWLERKQSAYSNFVDSVESYTTIAQQLFVTQAITSDSDINAASDRLGNEVRSMYSALHVIRMLCPQAVQESGMRLMVSAMKASDSAQRYYTESRNNNSPTAPVARHLASFEKESQMVLDRKSAFLKDAAVDLSRSPSISNG
jgi:hypothetical protein